MSQPSPTCEQYCLCESLCDLCEEYVGMVDDSNTLEMACDYCRKCRPPPPCPPVPSPTWYEPSNGLPVVFPM